jgi:hypothetical protein
MKKIVAGIGLLYCCTCLAQKYANDAQIRAGLNLEINLSKKFSVYIKNQERFTHNVSLFSRASGTIGLAFKLWKNLRISGDYSFISSMSSEGYYSNRNWYSLALLAKKDIKRWRLSYRNKVQARMQGMNSDRMNEVHIYDRNKLTLKYELNKRISPYLAEEIYIPLNSPMIKGLERSRSYAGIMINTFRHQQLELYFMYQAELQRNTWFKQQKYYDGQPLSRDYIYGVKYNIEF